MVHDLYVAIPSWHYNSYISSERVTDNFKMYSLDKRVSLNAFTDFRLSNGSSEALNFYFKLLTRCIVAEILRLVKDCIQRQVHAIHSHSQAIYSRMWIYGIM